MKLKRKIETRDWVNLTLIIIFIAAIIWLGVEYSKTLGEMKGNDIIATAVNFKQFILTYGKYGIFVVVFLQAFQVVVSFIPASLVQFAGGMIYGYAIGMITGIIGTAIGTALSFYLSRLLGRRVVTLFVSEKNINKLEDLLSKNSSTLALLILYTIPFPKDFIAYFIGLTSMKAHKLFLVSVIGRLPGMFIATYLGVNIFSGNYTLLIIITVATCVIGFIVYKLKDKILMYFSNREKK